MRALLAHESLLLADDMGLGKTVQAIAALRILLQTGAVAQALIVAPVGLLAQWRQELWTWAPEACAIRVDGPPQERSWKWAAPKQIYLASYETVRNDGSSRLWDLVILDEAQRIKNRESELSQACKRLRRQRSWVLTGTPLENCEEDLASLLEFAQPNPQGQRPPRLALGPRLRARHAELQLRRRKADVLKELPPKRVIRVALELGPEQRRHYQALESQATSELSGLGPRATVVNVLELITRLKQACNFCPKTGRSSKLEDLKRRLGCLAEQGQRALVFSQWVREPYGVERLARELEAFRPLIYTGGLEASQRQARIQAFRTRPEHQLLLLSLRAGGQGLNLQEASYVIHFDRWWNPAVENQATDRSHRLGQKQAVTVYAYTCLGTVEERIEEILDQKRHLFATLADGVSLDVRRLLTAPELFGLFGLPAPSARASPKKSPGSLPERVRRVLTACGWELESTDSPSFMAQRVDEIGLERRLQVDCGQAGSSTQAPGERLVVLPLQPCHEPGVTTWGLEELSQAEAAVEEAPHGSEPSRSM